MATITFKLKNAKSLDTVELPSDGKAFTILDLKFRIAQTKKLGGLDFDFKIRDTEGKEYKNEDEVVVAGTSFIAVRTNAKGAGLRARLRKRGMPTSIKAKPSAQKPSPAPAPRAAPAPAPKPAPVSQVETPASKAQKPSAAHQNAPAVPQRTDDDDDDDDAAENIQDILSSEPVATRAGPRIAGGATAATKPWAGGGTQPTAENFHRERPKRPLPPGYRCNRCHQEGHLIEDCPARDTQEEHIRVKPAKGIPMQHLEKIPDILMVDPHETRTVVKQNNEYFFVKEDLVSLTRRAQGLDSLEGVPKEMICVIDHKLAVDAIKFDCCEATASYKNAARAVMRPNAQGQKFRCPACGERCTPDDLVPAEDLRRRIAELLRQKRTGQPVTSTSDGDNKEANETSTGAASSAANVDDLSVVINPVVVPDPYLQQQEQQRQEQLKQQQQQQQLQQQQQPLPQFGGPASGSYVSHGEPRGPPAHGHNQQWDYPPPGHGPPPPFQQEPGPNGQAGWGLEPTGQTREGDWACRNCRFHNYATRFQCFRCGAPAPSRPGFDLHQQGGGPLNQRVPKWFRNPPAFISRPHPITPDQFEDVKRRAQSSQPASPSQQRPHPMEAPHGAARHERGGSRSPHRRSSERRSRGRSSGRSKDRAIDRSRDRRSSQGGSRSRDRGRSRRSSDRDRDRKRSSRDGGDRSRDRGRSRRSSHSHHKERSSTSSSDRERDRSRSRRSSHSSTTERSSTSSSRKTKHDSSASSPRHKKSRHSDEKNQGRPVSTETSSNTDTHPSSKHSSPSSSSRTKHSSRESHH